MGYFWNIFEKILFILKKIPFRASVNGMSYLFTKLKGIFISLNPVTVSTHILIIMSNDKFELLRHNRIYILKYLISVFRWCYKLHNLKFLNTRIVGIIIWMSWMMDKYKFRVAKRVHWHRYFCWRKYCKHDIPPRCCHF